MELSSGRELKNDEKTSITSGDGVSCLLLQNINTDDSGKYDVHVENEFGSESNYASVSVEGPPDPPSGKPCLIPGTDCATVNWSSSPYDGGRKVTGFAVEYSLVGSDVWTTVAEDCNSLSYVVTGLQAGGRYVFRVRSVNVHGASQPSQESDILQLEEQNEKSSFEPRIVSIEPGPEFKVKYDILEELGKGRYGVVHRVVDKTTNQKLAAKFIRCRTAKDRDKVQDEIDIMNLLRHSKLLQLAAAFENSKETIMVMEYISGGELFERVVADDFTLTEKDCILFMRQICEGVAYMHSQNVVHLDLKPENIMCHTRTSHEIKIIDFGLAQKLDPDRPTKVLFGTAEFIPPEIINYEHIGTESDMWCLGVICYVLLSGLSPFMGDNDAETFANITRAEYDFDDEAFDAVSQHARDFIGALLLKRKEDRMSAESSLKHEWLDPESHTNTVVISTDKLKKFIIRRKWQKTGNAIRALGRLANLSASRRNSATSSSPRPSISGLTVSRMSSLSEEETNLCDTNCNEVKHRKASRNCTERSDSGISDCSQLKTLERSAPIEENDPVDLNANYPLIDNDLRIDPVSRDSVKTTVASVVQRFDRLEFSVTTTVSTPEVPPPQSNEICPKKQKPSQVKKMIDGFEKNAKSESFLKASAFWNTPK
ncbi:PREDICTED: myosin light chain kinase, smooth muscle-like [Nicrophorus vespilloides]|uniref:Myosin light chain kinase, smooth muscle-like n=1 Tax=Nicrophorus vespilloides TaxID=110193 RepID=A0ABM1N9H5_NICVS|nr:PREDICTED: myosin light chain kinase, smooth muscle-like [Nicrophorus vespilloides]